MNTVAEPMSAKEVDRLARIARRDPMGVAAVSWSSVWVFAFFLFAVFFGDFFFVDGVLLLERIGIALLISAVISGGICRLLFNLDQRRVNEAKSILEVLRNRHVSTRQ